MKIGREHVASDAPHRPSALEQLPTVSRPAAFVAMVAGGSALAVAGDGDLLRALGVIVATSGTWLLGGILRPAPDAGLAGRVRDLTRERDAWATIATRLGDVLDGAGEPVGVRPPAPRAEAGPADGDEKPHHGGGRPGRLAALPPDHDAEGLDPSAGDPE